MKTKHDDPVIHVKVGAEEKKKFQEKCMNVYGVKYSAMIRDMISAFNEGRMTIKPTDEQSKLNEELYVTGK